MRVLRVGLLFAFSFLLMVIAVQAQESSTPAPRDPQAVSLLQRSLAALVDTTTVNDVTLNASTDWIAGSDNETGSATLKATAIGQGRVDLSLSDGQRSEVVDISQAPPVGSWCGTDGVWHSIVAHNLYTDPTWFFPTFLISRVLSGVNYAVSPMDAETQNGVAVEHVRTYQQPGFTTDVAALLQSLSQIDIYLNASTLLPVSVSFNTHADDNALDNVPIQIKFLNYQVVQGISVPYHIQKYIQNGLALDLTVTGVQVNSGLSTSDFQTQ
ncbi:MAG: hypothetical protein WBE86_00740 [Candidatus Acidiferrales bacterium]